MLEIIQTPPSNTPTASRREVNNTVRIGGAEVSIFLELEENAGESDALLAVDAATESAKASLAEMFDRG